MSSLEYVAAVAKAGAKGSLSRLTEGPPRVHERWVQA